MDEALKSIPRDSFPPLLNEIPEPPKQLWVRGTLPAYEWTWLTIVGSRTATQYGRRAVSDLVRSLSGERVVIVSGLAYGIDACAHAAALECGLPTVAVPGSGLSQEVLYPRAHVKLAERILEAGGALLSEFDPEQQATPYTFPRRNRIMAGLSRATLVVEAKERSGSLITARLAADYNRDLLVVPGSIFSVESRGTHQFLKLGATPITSPDDLRTALGLEANGEAATDRSDLSAIERRVLDLLADPRSREEIADALSLTAAESNILLSTMEIKGLLTDDLGVLRAL